ncbi:hypothetical protein HBH70_178810 [Parastagonospora nodorum]|nr:hypothetical protein HBH53_194510 [Parastagonospora nodorum]KAH4036002.1 hypothetical protein HBI09_081480 [Parastagonospora nodorum]KAH4106023.1 hypothetical protein HBH46_073530 [Parastagonospora nodorum]KAH4158639.1 hypothetical protein HBH43_192200 [Parastagonospora nodorum]KAH4218073.1 hypothetical protein HBI06_207140 [Parastagonospora nodorum]
MSSLRSCTPPQIAYTMNTLFDEQGTSPGHMSDQYMVKEPSAHTAGTLILIHTAVMLAPIPAHRRLYDTLSWQLF